MNDRIHDRDRPTATLDLDEFDRLQAEYEGLPNALKTHASIVKVTPFLPVEGVSTWIVQTLRHERGDMVFVELLNHRRHLRLVLPPSVTAAIARQRDQLASRSRSRAARSRATPGNAAHLLDPKVRARAAAARKRNAATRRAKRERREA